MSSDRPKIVDWFALDRRVLVVAVEGEVKDWSAYIGAVEGQNHSVEIWEVARHGTKLPYKVAKVLFPMVDFGLKWRS
jgi:hypothetical protein